MKKAILDVPLWERPEDCKLYVHLHRMDCFLSVIWTLVLILTMLDLFAIAEKLVSAWTFAPLFAAILFIPIIFRPRLRSKWRCPNCQTAFPYRNILARVDHIYGGYIQEFFAFLEGLYEVLKGLFMSYPMQIELYRDGMDIVYSKGKINRIASGEIKHIAFDIRPPQCGWWRLQPPNFKFYDSKNKLIIEGDVLSYAQFQEVYNLLQAFQLRIFIPNYTEGSYQKFFR